MELRKTLLRMSCLGHEGNLQSCFSSLEILWTLYDKVLQVSPGTWRDRFILSKGQANAALLAVLAKKGFLPEKELDTFCQYDSRVAMQADRTKLPCVEVSAGSLGHGLPVCVGMAWAAKIQKRRGRFFVLVGDGEMNEGTMWEAALFAASERLDNLVVIIDENGSAGHMINMGSLEAKMGSFGFETVTVDGHNEASMEKVLSVYYSRPCAIIAKTMRGYGCRTLMEDGSWFHRFPTAEELPHLMEEVDRYFAEEDRGEKKNGPYCI